MQRVSAIRHGVMLLVMTVVMNACGGGDSSTGPDPNAVSSVVIDATTVTLTAIGATQQLTATARNSAGNTVSGKSFPFTTSAANVATVSSTGLVTSVGNGSATITATVVGGTASATSQVTVSQAVATLALTPAASTVAIGATQPLTVAASDSRGVAIASPAVSFTSSNAAVASVSISGVVTALTVGTTTITATAGTVSKTSAITVVYPDLILSRDTTLSGTKSYRTLTIPANVTVTASAALTLRATGAVSIAGAVVGSCVPVDIGSDTALTVTGRVNNGCAAGTGGDLRLAATGELTLTNATITSSGDITLTNNPALSETSFLVSGTSAVSSLVSRPFSFAAQPGGVPFVNVNNSTVVYFGGGTGPNPAANGTSGTNGTNGANGRAVKMFLDGNAVFGGATLLWGQDGGDGGNGTNSANTNLTVNGGNGGDGGLIKVYITGTLTYTGPANTVRSGKGGQGGAASATTTQNAALSSAPSATAVGGNGGQPGLIDMRAGGGITISPGSLVFDIPVGGTGGNATAVAADGVDALVANATSPAQPGGAASARGGNGGSTPTARLSSSGVNGVPTLSVPGGGPGGVASAQAGKGGNGVKPLKDGAAGGAIDATGGTGGFSNLRNLANAIVGNGGDGGNAIWKYGNGGNGWNDCVVNQLEAGGNGGRGGNATGVRGQPGNGVAQGASGSTRFEIAGNGGNGGSGAGPGSGGNAGTNAVIGPIGSQIPPNFQAGTVGTNCTPPPQDVSFRIEGVTNSGGVVATGTQFLDLVANNVVRGNMAVQFTSPTFVGFNPSRLGLGPNGKITFKSSTAQVDGAAYGVQYARFCLINAPMVSVSNPVTVRELGIGVNNVLRTTTITSPTGCFERNTIQGMTDLEIAAAILGNVDLTDFIISISPRS